jgi:hypothetical protein
MTARYIFILFIFLAIASSCRVKRKEYIEKNGLHSDQKPHEMAAEIGKHSKSKQGAYKRALSRMWKKRHRGEKRSQNPYK